ncbi:hypothetical protein SAMN05421630_101157 [Prauserella marina]|uniref:Uncharacterized protein n=1 Tax=Prauserella marina TaxID=530584 RepID=A0A1G6IAL3_9PSEU|nr:XRE family transcriptional regulator [Prauserella marina]PWV85158.1 hypothetical protein DES30_1011181 [Prauserella marina]SDC03470.1 hypothetical protein SAMN05421630_101157 [Prauserella marina]
MAESVVDRNRKQQIEWYGEPLGDRLGRLIDRLDVSQAGLAGILGISAPMLSQLMSGNRAKISNPAVFSRLLSVEALATDAGFDDLPAREIKERLAAIQAEPMTSTTSIRVLAPETAHSDPVGGIQALLREIASAAEIEHAASILDADYPELAELLRVYGAGRASEAREHFARTLAPKNNTSQ